MGILLPEHQHPIFDFQVFIIPGREMPSGGVLHAAGELDEMGFRVEHGQALPYTGAAIGASADSSRFPD
jgi:hypothetical protein